MPFVLSLYVDRECDIEISFKEIKTGFMLKINFYWIFYQLSLAIDRKDA